MDSVFELLHEAPLTRRMRSRDGCIYMGRAMKFIGWIPPRGKVRWLYMVWTVMTTLFCIGYLPIAFVMSYITEIKGFTPGQFLTSLQVGINAAGSSVKASLTYASMWRFDQAQALLDQMDKRCTSDDERTQVHRVVARCNRVFLTYQILYSGYVTSAFLSGVLAGQLPWKLYNPFVDWQESTPKFWLASMFEYFIMAGAVLQDQLSDVYPVMYGFLLRAHIGLLQQRIRKLRTQPSSSSERNYQDLIECINDHKLILQYCNAIRPAISGTIFTQFLLIGVVLGLSLINVLFFSDFWAGFATCMFIAAILLQTFPFCYICNMVMEDCMELTLAIFQSNWIDADRRYKSTLLYYLHNVQQPITFMAGGFLQICMASNISVAKLAFSVVTFVKQMNIADKFQND